MRLLALMFVRDLALPPEVVWPHVSAPEHLSAWASVEISTLAPGPGGSHDEAGATREVRMSAGGLPLVMEEQILVFDPPQRLVYSVYKGGGMRWHEGSITLEPTESGTRLLWSISLQPRIPGTGWIFRRSLSRQFEGDLDALEARLAGPVAE